MRKGLYGLILIFAMLTSFLPIIAKATIVDSGTCGANGDNLIWTLDDKGTLTISGIGEMQNYDFYNSPSWCHNSYIKNVVIKNGVTNIGFCAFYFCNLFEIDIANSVTNIGPYAFSGCTNLKNIRIPKGVTHIGHDAFYNCYNLTNIIMPNGILKIDEGTFGNCDNLISINIPNTVENIGADAFAGCDKLTNIIIPNNVICIGGGAFEQCNSLTNVTILSDIPCISEYTFYKCKNLTSIHILNSITDIAQYAFFECDSLSDIYYSGTQKQFDNINIGQFNNCFLNATVHCIINGNYINDIIYDKEIVSKHYGATKFKRTPEGEIYAAATAYNKALEEYLKAVKSEAKKTAKGNKTLKEKAQSLILKDESAKYKYLRFTTGTGTIPEQPKIGAYMALAEYFDYLADTAESKLNIDLDDEAYMIDAKLTKQILAKVGHYSKTSQQNGWTVSMNIVSFAKQGTGYMTIKKGSLSYYAIFSSSPEDVRDALNNFLGEIRDVTDDITKSAAKSLFAEISDITGFGDYYEALIKDSVKKSIKSLRNKGFGNILTVFKKCSDGYDLVHGIIAFSDARHIENTLSNAEDIYNKLSRLDYSDSAVDNFIIKQAMNKVNNAKNTLCDELYDYMYSIGKPPKKEGFFDKVTSWMKSVFQCPVDFTVYNTDGEVIGYVRDGEVYYNDDIYIETSDDVKNLYVPSDMEGRIEMTGTDEGEFNYVLEEVTDGEPVGRLNYYGIPLTEGASFEQTLNSESIAGGTDNPISSQDGDINADEYLSADDLTAFVTVETEYGDEGVVIGAGDYAKGDSVELTALASDDKYTLSGWYIGDELVSTDETYRFTALENVTVRAEFARDYAVDYDYTTEMSDDCGDYYAYVYKDSDDGQGIIITPFMETPDDSLDIYLTAYEETTQYSAQIDETGRYDFKNVDLHNASSVVIKDSTGTVIATMNRGNTIEQSIQTVGQYRYYADVTAYEENGEVVVDFDIIDNTLTAEDITAYLASYTEEGALISCDILNGAVTENGVKFIANPSGKYKILFWDDNQEPITEALSVNVD